MTKIEPALPEVREADAAPAIAQIYGEVRRWSAVPMVALIFRNLATYPGQLEEVWAAVSPLFQAGGVQEAAWSIAKAQAPSGLLPKIGAHARPALGIDEAARGRIVATLDAYNRANPVNLLTMLSLLARVRDGGPSQAPTARTWTPPPAVPGPLPEMTPPAAMTPEIRRLINDFGYGDRGALDPVVPSLYRHFTGWPGLLGALHVLLAPRFQDGTIEAATIRVQQAMAAEARRLAASVGPLPMLAANAAALRTLGQFTDRTIPTMVVVGALIKEALG